MRPCDFLRSSSALLLIILMCLVATVLSDVASESGRFVTGDCDECGVDTLLYKWCPSSVGCGYADPSGVTCYCNDWTWCSDLPDCKISAKEEPLQPADASWAVVMKPCNSSDPLQWITSMDIFCSLFQPISFSPRTSLNDVVVLTMAIEGSTSNQTIFAAYVPQYSRQVRQHVVYRNLGHRSPIFKKTLRPLKSKKTLLTDLTPNFIFSSRRPLNMSVTNQLWQYSNFTFKSQQKTDFCLDSVNLVPTVAPCNSTAGGWTSVNSQTDYPILQYTGTSYCLAIDPR